MAFKNGGGFSRSEEHTSELQSRLHLVCRLLLEKKKPSPSPRAEMSRRRSTPRRSSGSVTWARRPERSSPRRPSPSSRQRFFFNDTATTEIYTLSLHDALPISEEIENELQAIPNTNRVQVIGGRP